MIRKTRYGSIEQTVPALPCRAVFRAKQAMRSLAKRAQILYNEIPCAGFANAKIDGRTGNERKHKEINDGIIETVARYGLFGECK